MLSSLTSLSDSRPTGMWCGAELMAGRYYPADEKVNVGAPVWSLYSP